MVEELQFVERLLWKLVRTDIRPSKSDRLELLIYDVVDIKLLVRRFLTNFEDFERDIFTMDYVLKIVNRRDHYLGV